MPGRRPGHQHAAAEQNVLVRAVVELRKQRHRIGERALGVYALGREGLGTDAPEQDHAGRRRSGRLEVQDALEHQQADVVVLGKDELSERRPGVGIAIAAGVVGFEVRGPGGLVPAHDGASTVLLHLLPHDGVVVDEGERLTHLPRASEDAHAFDARRQVIEAPRSLQVQDGDVGVVDALPAVGADGLKLELGAAVGSRSTQRTKPPAPCRSSPNRRMSLDAARS